MGNRKLFAVVLLCCLIAVVASMPAEHVELAQDGEAISTYLVHVAYSHSPRATRNTARLTRAYTSFLRDTLPTGMNAPAPSILYSYAHAMTGFAARLTARQAAHLEAQPSVLAVIPDRLYELHTTLSSSFLGLTPSSPLMMESNSATDVVIGVIDTGIYPKDRASFAADPSMTPPPRTFRGGCVSTPDFNATEYCNNKLVGAKFFKKGQVAMASRSPLDVEGHGTHCASIAAGAPVPNANLFGFGQGTAKGTASGARIASYNVCGGRCTSIDIVAGINEAIADRVDVLSISISVSFTRLLHDPMMTASFRAVRESIFVSTPAGNYGPRKATVRNLAPWVCTVGASTMNREFRATVVLGNRKIYTGYSLYSGRDPYGKMKPLVYSGDAGSDWCEAGKLEPSKVKGKIVLCAAGGAAQGLAVKQAGGVGAIIASSAANGEYTRADAHLLPAASVTNADYLEILKYSRTPNPVARIFYFRTFTGFVNPPSPRVASFSSRGPNRVAPEILKPDIIAPGVQILAAWTGQVSPSKLDIDERRVEFNIISGTSMATPQMSGIAALLKAARPKWSPAAIKSAMMTTAYNVDNHGVIITDMSTGKAAGPFEIGAGHVDPNRALDPGLVYDADEDDYISFLCALGYTPNIVAIFTGGPVVEDICSKRQAIAVGDHNYPAFSVAFKSYDEKVTQRRVVRNVGSNVNAVYTLSYRALPIGWSAIVSPSKLVFDAAHQNLEYTVTFSLIMSAASKSSQTEAHSALVWTDGKHKVVSPIVLTWPTTTAAMAVM
ncbi:subtilisin-like protease SBT1.4 [Lolium perenne]|uniref:subtilisin-like protease SBT1.4 n=1 Tax=Lolium perenne TaxID=4522 RepID=UPI0021EA5FA6|nr:subtilisin-like protease SBT1.4 [Lolium perenne]